MYYAKKKIIILLYKNINNILYITICLFLIQKIKKIMLKIQEKH